MHWNDAGQIIRDLKDTPREEILEVLRTALLESMGREGATLVLCRECGELENFTPEPLLSSDPLESPTPFYMALQNAKVAQ